jgi:Flp pilus assembly protein protease CpaA
LFVFEVARLAPLIAILCYAAIMDHRHGEVSNKIWLYIPIGAALTLIQIWLYTPYLFVFAVPLMIVMGGLCVVLFYLSDYLEKMLGAKAQMFGGADSKALLAISLCYPLTPSFSVLPYTNFLILAFGFAVLVVVVRKGLRRRVAVRFLPYLFFGFLLFGL